MKKTILAAVAASAFALVGDIQARADVLPSWNETGNKAAIVEFVEAVTAEGSQTYLAPEDRIAVFDNDGTLWTEKPTYTEVIFALEQVQAMASDIPEWQTEEPFSIIAEKGLGALKEIGLSGAITAVAGVYARLDDDQINARAAEFLAKQHLSAGRSNFDTTYSPMVGLVDYLRNNGFTVYIVSGGTNNFLRTFAEDAYGVPPQNIIGSVMDTEVVSDNNGVSLRRLPQLANFNDGESKVVNIWRRIGTRPTVVVGNSDGDLPMTQWALAGEGPRLGLLVNHDDDTREASYDRGAADAIEAARPEGDNFLLISMKADFMQIWK